MRWLLLGLVVGCTDGEVGRDGPRDSVEDGFVDSDRGVVADGAPADAAPIDATAVDAAPRDAGPDASPTDAQGADAAPADAFGPDAAVSPCGPVGGGLAEVERGGHRAWVEVETDATCRRTYRLHTTQPLRDGVPQNPRIIEESADEPRLRSGSPLVDALYALAIDEATENAVAAIQDGAFQDGQPLPCPPGGCYETGRLWHYVWTRDTAYATALGLAVLDPQRVRNSLEFKLSEPSGGGPEQVMQDTGTGGSHPISTDRVIWAMGARALLPQLEGDARRAFARRAFDALRATAEHDLAVAFDAEDGLYRGEQSFLDWREQSYPAWVADHVAHIGMSKSLSTNIAHLISLELLGNLASELGEADPWTARAQALRMTLRDRFWDAERRLFHSFITTGLDGAPARQYDLLGNALAILEGVATLTQTIEAVSDYSVYPAGPAVILPQQQFTPIYHNRATWPFVTAFWLKAARHANNVGVSHAVALDLIEGAALNLSHMENLEAVTGLPFVEDGAYSGPVVNSQRQLWSVAGFLSFVHETLLGLEPRDEGVRMTPAIGLPVWEDVLGNPDQVRLEGYPYRARRLAVVLHRPEPGFEVGEWPAEALVDGTQIEHAAALMAPEAGALRTLDCAHYRTCFAPRVPRITAVETRPEGLWVAFDLAGEADVQVAVYRDGERIAEEIQGVGWLDAGARAGDPTHCYTIESQFTDTFTVSQRAAPVCAWGPDGVQTFNADRLTAVGGQKVNEHGRLHVQVWADAGQGLALDDFTVPRDGRWLVQAVYSNGAGSVTTGITCGLLRVRVLEGEREVGRGYLPLPHTGAWGTWRDSGFVGVDLRANTRYRLVLDGEEHAYNMSKFQHFRRYTGGPGGDAPFNRANISALKLLGR